MEDGKQVVLIIDDANPTLVAAVKAVLKVGEAMVVLADEFRDMNIIIRPQELFVHPTNNKRARLVSSV